jgi:hypothetical protein
MDLNQALQPVLAPGARPARCLLRGKAGDIARPQKILEDRAQKSTICSANTQTRAHDRAQAALYAQN